MLKCLPEKLNCCPSSSARVIWMVSRRRAMGWRKGIPSRPRRLPVSHAQTQDEAVAGDCRQSGGAMAVFMAVRANTGSMPVASRTLCVVVAIAASAVSESRPAPSGTHTIS